MKRFTGKNPDPGVARSVSDLVAEGGNVLASDDAPTVADRAGGILPRPGLELRATLHLPAGLAFAKKSKPRSQAAPGGRTPRPRARMTLGRVRSANGSG